MDWANIGASKLPAYRLLYGTVQKDMATRAFIAVNDHKFGTKTVLRGQAEHEFLPGDVISRISMLPLLGLEPGSCAGAVKGVSRLGGAASVYCNAAAEFTNVCWPATIIVGCTLEFCVNAHCWNGHVWLQASMVSKGVVRLFGKVDWRGKVGVSAYLGDAVVVENVEGLASPNASWWHKLSFVVANENQRELVQLWWGSHEANEHVTLSLSLTLTFSSHVVAILIACCRCNGAPSWITSHIDIDGNDHHRGFATKH